MAELSMALFTWLASYNTKLICKRLNVVFKLLNSKIYKYNESNGVRSMPQTSRPKQEQGSSHETKVRHKNFEAVLYLSLHSLEQLSREIHRRQVQVNITGLGKYSLSKVSSCCLLCYELMPSQLADPPCSTNGE